MKPTSGFAEPTREELKCKLELPRDSLQEPCAVPAAHPEQLLPPHPPQSTLLPLHSPSRATAAARGLCWPKSAPSAPQMSISADGTAPPAGLQAHTLPIPSPAAQQGWLGSPGCPQVHEQVTVVDSWHPHQLLVLCHRVPVRGRERLQLGELGLQKEVTHTWHLF